jgi:tetratricopeptide (TPR) repeat protein
MPEAPVDWIPAVTMLGIGVVVGAVLIWRLLRSARVERTAGKDVETRDLEGRRDALVRQLRELDDTSTKLTPEQLSRERYRIELETAAILRDLDERAIRSEEALEGEEPAAAPPRPAWVPFAWGVGSTAAIAILVIFVMQRAAPREEGGTVTGNLPGEGQQQVQQTDTDLQTLLSAVERNPNDVNMRLELAFAYLLRRDLMAVFNQTEAVLQLDPENARALSYQALVRLAMGQAEDAEAMLKRALEKEPDLLDGWIHLALVYSQTGRMKEAEEALAEAIRRHPEERQTLESILAQIKGSDTPAEPAPAQSPSAPSGPSIAGVVTIDPSLAPRLTPQSMLFVSVRPAGATSGPPIAVRRLPINPGNVPFSVSAADSMMGQPLPEKMRVDARIDTDGDPMSRNAADPQASIDGVSVGAGDLELVLR